MVVIKEITKRSLKRSTDRYMFNLGRIAEKYAEKAKKELHAVVDFSTDQLFVEGKGSAIQKNTVLKTARERLKKSGDAFSLATICAPSVDDLPDELLRVRCLQLNRLFDTLCPPEQLAIAGPPAAKKARLEGAPKPLAIMPPPRQGPARFVFVDKEKLSPVKKEDEEAAIETPRDASLRRAQRFVVDCEDRPRFDSTLLTASSKIHSPLLRTKSSLKALPAPPSKEFKEETTETKSPHLTVAVFRRSPRLNPVQPAPQKQALGEFFDAWIAQRDNKENAPSQPPSNKNLGTPKGVLKETLRQRDRDKSNAQTVKRSKKNTDNNNTEKFASSMKRFVVDKEEKEQKKEFEELTAKIKREKAAANEVRTVALRMSEKKLLKAEKGDEQMLDLFMNLEGRQIKMTTNQMRAYCDWLDAQREANRSANAMLEKNDTTTTPMRLKQQQQESVDCTLSTPATPSTLPISVTPNTTKKPYKNAVNGLAEYWEWMWIWQVETARRTRIYDFEEDEDVKSFERLERRMVAHGRARNERHLAGGTSPVQKRPKKRLSEGMDVAKKMLNAFSKKPCNKKLRLDISKNLSHSSTVH